MKQRSKLVVAVAAIGILVAVAIVLGRGRNARRASSPTSPGGAAVAGGERGPTTTRTALPDPRTLTPAAIRGTVRAKDGGPLADAQVCSSWYAEGLDSEQAREPACATTGADGAYQLTPLVPGRHEVVASAGGHVPRAWRASTGFDNSIELVAGQAKDGVDFVLAPGGVEVRGTVLDINGGPIAEARVTVSSSGFMASARTSGKADAQGRFVLWAAPGSISVAASAEGYADGDAEAVAPAKAVEVLLTPEASLAGIVVEAGSRAPVADVLVAVDDDGDGMGFRWRRGATSRTDAAGKFRIARLSPGRYKPVASGRGVYGEPTASVLLGLGQRVDDVVIEVHPAQVVRGRIEIEQGGARTPCTDGSVNLVDKVGRRSEHDASDSGGEIELTAVRAGNYEVTVRCEGYVAKEQYPPVVVATADVTGLIWTVAAGGAIRGVVRTAGGEPVEGVVVGADPVGLAARARRSWGGDVSRADGSFALTGLDPAEYKLEIWSEHHRAPQPPPQATVRVGEEARVDVVLAASGEIAGVVVDPTGAPVAGADIEVNSSRMFSFGGGARSGEDGRFLARGVEPGERRVTASRGWSDELRRPGTTDDDVQGERVKVVAGKTASVRLVVESRSGVIRGTVRDDRGEPVSDAWVVANRESDAAGALAGRAARATRWSWGRSDRPVVTDPTGAFVVRELSPGNYTLRAYRRGGGEAVAEHVAVGGTVALVIKATGEVAGTVAAADGTAPEEFEVGLRDPQTSFVRSESFYRTGGAFTMRDLPAGNFAVTVTAAGGRAMQEVALAAGEQRAGLRFVLEGNRTVRGRIVDVESGAPVPAITARITPRKGSSDVFSFTAGEGGARKHISGEDGRFEIAEAPVGKAYLVGFPIDFADGEYGFIRHPIEIAGEGEIDLGDIPAAKRRVKRDETAGDLGLGYVEQPPDTEPERLELKVSHVRPGGPAATAGIAAGDVVIAVDGVDVRAERHSLAWALMSVKVGTKLRLGLARGATVEVTAGPPP